jgi:hypothetical protein
VPAPAVIPAPVTYLEVAAVKTLVAGGGVPGGPTAGVWGLTLPPSAPAPVGLPSWPLGTQAARRLISKGGRHWARDYEKISMLNVGRTPLHVSAWNPFALAPGPAHRGAQHGKFSMGLTGGSHIPGREVKFYDPWKMT